MVQTALCCGLPGETSDGGLAVLNVQLTFTRWQSRRPAARRAVKVTSLRRHPHMSLRPGLEKPRSQGFLFHNSAKFPNI